MDRLTSTFNRTRAAGRAALVGCLPAGYPTVKDSITTLRALSWHADVLVVKLPRDGQALEDPDILQNSRTTPAADTAWTTVTEFLREVSATTSIPVMLMSHGKFVTRAGPEHLAAAAASAGAAGVILPDLRPTGAVAARWLAAAGRHRLATTFLAGRDHFSEAATASTGWVHLPATTEPADTAGVLDLAELHHRIRQVRGLTEVPICTGMGITSPELAAAVAPGVDGVVVGSAFVRALQHPSGRKIDLSRLDHRAARYAAALRAVPGARRFPTAAS